ncbi:MAG: hypothetical protein K6E20_02405 [Acholeplasmatales bacterium]|nr:hypothetical protein [Acholeplasmatales bacterium]
MKTQEYKRFTSLKHLTLDDIYNNLSAVVDILDFNIANVIEYEAPITLNTLKARMREAFDVAKISANALDVILDRVNKLGYYMEMECFDYVIWPKSGKFNVKYLRINSDRLIYDIPKDEFKNLVLSYDLEGEELKREVLGYFGLIRLTEKASEYIDYVKKNC